ncbi:MULTISPECIES: phage antirepressor N-terminal domain-containing protein [unclassified Cedecea]|uniref:phage antirepressor N-terminal domain-containing protein n=1 Tax=unclassified Cedecea TaxID=2649846 RepID=UPI003015BA7E
MGSKNDETPKAATFEVSNLPVNFEKTDMTSLAIADRSINVPFHGADLYVVSVGGEVFTPMRPIIDGMGMTYQGQVEKLKSRFSKGVREIMIPTKGGEQTMLCLALRKLNGWLQTISPNKVKPEIRERVIQYQNECDDVLYEYWTTGQVTPRAEKKASKSKLSTATQLTPLRQTAERLITTGIGKIYPDIWKLVHQKFEIEHIHQLRPEQIFEAVEYLNAIEGEYLGNANKQMGLPISYSMSYFDRYRWMDGIDDHSLSAPWRYPAKMLTPNGDNPNPLGRMLGEMRQMGYEVDAALFQLQALQHNLEMIRHKIDRVQSCLR